MQKERLMRYAPRFARKPSVTASLTLLLALLALPAMAADNAIENESRVELVVGAWLENEREGNDRGDSLRGGKLDFPFGVDFDSQGNMFTVEMSGGRVLKLDKQGTLTTIAGQDKAGYSGDGGPATDATFREMHNLAIDSHDNIYIADSANHAVRRIDAKTGIITTVAGNGEQGFDGDSGKASDARFKKTICIAFGPEKKKLYIADIYNIRIRAIDIASGQVKTVAGNGKSGVPQNGDAATAGPLADPRAVAVDSNGNTYVLERAGHALRKIDRKGEIHTIAGSGRKGYRDGAALESQFDGPKHICLDDRGNVYIADDVNAAIRKYDPRTKQVTTVLGRGQGDASITLSKPHGVTFYRGKLYVVDSGNNRVLAVTVSTTD